MEDWLMSNILDPSLNIVATKNIKTKKQNKNVFLCEGVTFVWVLSKFLHCLMVHI